MKTLGIQRFILPLSVLIYACTACNGISDDPKDKENIDSNERKCRR